MNSEKRITILEIVTVIALIGCIALSITSLSLSDKVKDLETEITVYKEENALLVSKDNYDKTHYAMISLSLMDVYMSSYKALPEGTQRMVKSALDHDVDKFNAELEIRKSK